METGSLDITREVENILGITDDFFFLFFIDTDTGLGAIFQKTWLLWYEVFDKSRPDDFSIFDDEIEVDINPLKIRFECYRRKTILLNIMNKFFLCSNNLNKRLSYAFNTLENERKMLCSNRIIIHARQRNNMGTMPTQSISMSKEPFSEGLFIFELCENIRTDSWCSEETSNLSTQDDALISKRPHTIKCHIFLFHIRKNRLNTRISLRMNGIS